MAKDTILPQLATLFKSLEPLVLKENFSKLWFCDKSVVK